MSRSLFRTAVSRVRAIAAAALFILAQAPAWAQSPEMQDILNQISGEFRRTQGERLSENCDYTAIDIAKQALQRAGFTNMAAGPVVIGALEKSCKAALSLTGAGLAADAYSLSKCVYEYYTTGMDARGLVTCLGVEAAGVGAGKLLDWLDVDPVTGAFSGQVFDRIGDDLKAGGLDEAAARLKEGEVRQFAERMAEALTQVQRAAREKAQSESPEPIVYTGFAYGCTVTIISRFNKGQPPTRGGNSVAVQISIRDCECYGRAPTVGKAMKEASIFVTVPVDFTPGPGRSPAWTANLARMRTTIRSVCCDGTRTGADPPGGDTGGGTATGGGIGVVPGTPTQPVEPPPPPPPPKPPPTLAERCPECAPIIADIAQDQADIESAQGRIDRADEELRTLRNERADLNDEIDRAQQTIRMNRNRISLPSGGAAGGPQVTNTLTADGVKVTTTTYPDGRVETRESRTGNRDIDAARDRIAAARAKLKDLEQREAAARQRREAAAADKARAEAKLRADEARLRECEERCRRRLVTGDTIIGTVIGVTGTNPFNPDNPIGTPQGPQAPPPPPPPGSPGTLQFSSSSYATAEGQGVVVITVTRSGGATGATTVQYATGQDSATAGADYQSANGTLAWADGEMGGKSFSVAIIDDTSVEGSESFSITLGVPTGAATLGSPSTATVSIADNDGAAPAGSLQFSASSYSTAEGQGNVTITVTRTGGAGGAVSVRYITVSGTAGGSDFGPASAALDWADGDTSAKSFTIAIVDDTVVEGAETFSVQLSNPTGGATLGSPGTTTVSIADNDTSTGACGPTGNVWQVNSGTYTCFGSCDPCPTPQRLSVDGNRVTISPFHAGGAATFTGCTSPLMSDSNSLIYFGQANHRATLSRSSNTGYSAAIQSSSSGSCTMSCIRTGP